MPASVSDWDALWVGELAFLVGRVYWDTQPRPDLAGTWYAVDQLPHQLPQMLMAMQALYDGDDARALLSQWSKYYLRLSVIPAMLHLYWTGQPLSMEGRVCQVLLAGGLPQAIILPHQTTDVADTPEQRYQSLLHAHLQPLIESWATLTRMSVRVLWGNVGNLMEQVLTWAATQTQWQAQAQTDRQWLFEQAIWPTQRNPLRQSIRYLTPERPPLPERMRVRRTCCLRDQLPDEPWCGSCPRLLTVSQEVLVQQWAKIDESS
jgi:ferric iron reductase protein FhuF